MSRHATDPISLLLGMIFAAVGGFLLADRVDLVVRLRWAWPALLIVAAVAVLVSLATSRSRATEPSAPWSAQGGASPPPAAEDRVDAPSADA